jgi:hypothetical protein
MREMRQREALGGWVRTERLGILRTRWNSLMAVEFLK